MIEENRQLKGSLKRLSSQLKAKEEEGLFATPNGSVGIEEDEMNRGPEDHEKDSKNEEEVREGSNGKGYGRRKKEQASSESLLPQTVDVILRLLQGMQDIQKNKKIVKSSGKDDGDGEGSPEVVQRGVELPKLPEPSPETGPIDFSDWLLVIHGTPSSCTTTSPGSEEIAEIGKEGFFFTSGRNTRRTERGGSLFTKLDDVGNLDKRYA